MLAVTSGAEEAYPVEVSGWDDHQNFFVEKTELHWSEVAGKHIVLQRRVPSGTLVFLRLLDPMGVLPAKPVPYRAERYDEEDCQPCRVRLLPAKNVSISN